MFDLTVLPFLFQDGQETSDLPGLLVQAAPRKAARQRAHDQLVLMLRLTGDVRLSPEKHQELLNLAAETYFASGGPVTSGLKEAAARLNEILLNRNLKNTRDPNGDWQAAGLLSMAVIRTAESSSKSSGASVVAYLALAGGSGAWVLGRSKSEEFLDPQGSARPLGLSKQINLRFSVAEISAGDVLVLAAQPTSAWTAQALGAGAFSIEQFRRRLATLAGNGEAVAVAIRFQPGSGQIQRLGRAATPSTPPSTLPSAPGARQMDETPPKALTEEEPLAQTAPAAVSERPQRSVAAPSAAETPPRPTPPRRSQRRSASFELPAGFRASAARFVQWTHSVRDRFQALIARILPPESAAAPALRNAALSPTALLAIALITPVVVSSIAGGVYVRRGLDRQREVLLYQAEQTILKADSAADAAAKRAVWEAAIDWIDQAEQYGQNEASSALRNKVQVELDALDQVIRLDFTSAIASGLDAKMNITSMAAGMNDLYLLDGSQGRVLRAIRTTKQYEIDTQFVCGPGTIGSVQVGPLVDMSILSNSNSFNASLIAIDAAGTVLLCTAGSEGPTAIVLPQPDISLGQITGIAYDQGVLHILDPQNNAVWRYTQAQGAFPNEPRLFFANQVPRMNDVIDLAVNQDDLYLLHGDGSMTLCTFSDYIEAPTRCTDPVPYGDQRVGKEASPTTLAGSKLTQIQTTQPPDPSLYALDLNEPSIIQFSLRLNLYRILAQPAVPDFPFPRSAPTAFVITPHRVGLLAFGNQVFMTSLP